NVYRVADKITGPYRRGEHDEILPGENFVFKPCVWKGKTLYFHNLNGTADWPAGKRGPLTTFAPPKIADADEDGALVLRPFDGWDAVAAGETSPLGTDALLANGKAVSGHWSARDGVLRGEAPSGYGALLLRDPRESYRLCVDLDRHDAKE